MKPVGPSQYPLFGKQRPVVGATEPGCSESGPLLETEDFAAVMREAAPAWPQLNRVFCHETWRKFLVGFHSWQVFLTDRRTTPLATAAFLADYSVKIQTHILSVLNWLK
jgi:hypothetical protein